MPVISVTLVTRRLPSERRITCTIRPTAEAIWPRMASGDSAMPPMATIHANTPRDALSRLEQMIGMAGMPMTIASIRGQIAAAIRGIVQLQRLSDGKRVVTSIAEITGLEGDIIQMQEIFKYVRTGTAEDGTVQGHFQATGVRPRFLSELTAKGIIVPAGHFDPTKPL